MATQRRRVFSIADEHGSIAEGLPVVRESSVKAWVSIIKKVAMCGGSGSFLLDEAVEAGADAFLTGEMHYHEYFGREQQIQIAVIGHYQSEQFTSEIFRDIIERECQSVKCFIAETCTNPIMYF